MTSLRDRLTAKQPRRVQVTLQVSAPDEAQAAVITEVMAQKVVATDPAEVTRLDAALEVLLDEHRVTVEFQALASDEMERVISAYPSPDATDGGMDSDAALPVLAALCAVDEDLQDDRLWVDLVKGKGWSRGEVLGLWAALLRLNTDTPSPTVPKG